MMNNGIDDLAAALRRGRNADGGWGYYPGKSSRLEPTALAALAFADTGDGAAAASALHRWPSTDGLLLERESGAPNFGFQGLALLAMCACHVEHASGTASLTAGLQRVKGVRLEPSGTSSRQDNSLQAWSWIPETFSWVEPTAWCMLALKQRARRPLSGVDPARLDEAERLLINRSCVSGGWNYGNADVMGKDLRPYVPTTAIALLAMQNRRDHPVVERSVDYLEKEATSERSGTALALALIALRVYGRSDDAVRSALITQVPTTIALQNHASIALAAYALNPEQSCAAFTL
jgi:hypothetical protein